MKSIIFLSLIMLCSFKAMAQYPFKIAIEPNLRTNVEYVMVSEDGASYPSGKRYARKGEYKSVAKTEFIADVAAELGVESGYYDPTFSDSTNMAAEPLNADSLNYLKIGNVVHVSGNITIDATADSTATVLEIDLPFEIEDTGESLISGVASFVSGTVYMTGTITSNTAGDEALIRFYPTNQSANAWNISFTYRTKLE